MHKFSFLATVALIVMLATTPLGHGADVTGGRSHAQLNATLQEFMTAFNQQDYKGVWRLLSRNVQDGNDNDQAEYERYVRAHGFHPSDFVIEKIVREDGKALITVKVAYADNASNKILGGATEVWSFVQEDGSWFFDDYMSLSEW